MLTILALYIAQNSLHLSVEKNSVVPSSFGYITAIIRRFMLKSHKGVVLAKEATENLVEESNISRARRNSVSLKKENSFINSMDSIISNRDIVGKILGQPSSLAGIMEANNFFNHNELEVEQSLLSSLRLASIVRTWVTEEMNTEKQQRIMHKSLIFKDSILEKQFKFYYLYVHMIHIRVLLLVGLTVSFVALPLSLLASESDEDRVEEYLIRGTLIIVTLAAIPLTSRCNVEKMFFFVDWALSFTAFVASVCTIAVLRFDEAYSESTEEKLIAFTQLFVLVWVFGTGTVWVRKFIYVAINFCIFSLLVIMDGKHDNRAAMSAFGRFKIIISYGVYLCVAIYISRVIELYHRIQFHRCWEYAKEKYEAEDALIKSKFTDEQIAIIQQVMENKNNDIDDELQEVLIDSEVR